MGDDGLAAALRRKRATVWFPMAVFSVLFGIELAIALALNGGHFSYALDDPYIHLAQAEGIAGGHYGVSPHEPAAPSSSIVWPYLLAPFARFAVGHYVPLVLSIAASLATLAICSAIVSRALARLEYARRHMMVAVGVALLIPAMNLIGLTFSGMEHSVQVFMAALVVFGLIREQETGRVSWWLALAVVVGPLIRYENLSLTLPTLVYFAWRRHVAALLYTGAAVGAALIGFSLYLHSLGLGILPTSITAKSGPISSAHRVGALIWSIQRNLGSRQGAILSAGFVLLLLGAWSGRDARDRALGLWGAAAIIPHVTVGQFGSWFPRYEIYLWTSTILTLLYVYRDWIGRTVEHLTLGRFSAAVSILVVLLCMPYLAPLVFSPLASNNIYEQQYQMHRFVTEYYRGPVAVNDLGWVSYRNEEFVLDLRGLASKEAFGLSRRRDMEWLDELAARHDVHLAMVYKRWFREIPDSWIPVGELILGRPRVTPAYHIVTFYALDRETYTRVRRLVVEYQKTLPGSAYFVPAPEAGPARIESSAAFPAPA